MQPDGSLPCPRKPAVLCYSELNNPRDTLTAYLFIYLSIELLFCQQAKIPQVVSSVFLWPKYYIRS